MALLKNCFLYPDIDKWNKWRMDILTLIKEVDYALIDGTFFKNGELKNRDMSEIPHPFVTESIGPIPATGPIRS